MKAYLPRNIILTALLFISIITLNSQILPSDRIYNWEKNAGVSGGIPHRTKIGSTVDAATYGNGKVDASAAIKAAIKACPKGQVVFIPAGTYRLDNPVQGPDAGNITIRGAGMGKTILKAGTKIRQLMALGDGDPKRPVTGIPVTGGATAGSKVLTVENTSTINVGNLIRIEQNDLPYVISTWTPDKDNKRLSVTFKVTAKTGTTVTVTPALPFTFTLSPQIVQYVNAPLINTGAEDMTLDCNGLCGVGIEIVQSWGCWVKNVEIMNSTNRQMLFICFVSGEIRHNYAHSTTSGGPDHEGIDFYEDCCFNLIEDNISYDGGFPGIILGDYKGGCAGNVIAYNFVYNTNTGYANTAGMDISVSHGPQNIMNLVEGNIASGYGSDGYHGSSSHNTALRNWFTATHPYCTGNLIAVNIGRWNPYFSLIGNILGTSAFSSNGLYMPEKGFGYSDQVIYKLGYPNMGNNSFKGSWGPSDPPSYVGQSETGGKLQEFDLNVRNTIIIHGNFDYKNKTIIWDPSLSDRKIPSSYFRRTRPEYFGKLTWPPFDPASPPGEFNDANLSRIPAGYRFVHGVDP